MWPGSATSRSRGVGVERVLRRGHEVGVEGAGHGERAHARAAGRRLGEFGEIRQCPGRDDLPGAVAVGGRETGRLDARHDLVRIAAEYGRHPGRGERAGRGHLGAAACGEGNCCGRRERADDCGGGEFADAVPGRDRAAAASRARTRRSCPIATISGWVTAVSLISSAPGRGAQPDQVETGDFAAVRRACPRRRVVRARQRACRDSGSPDRARVRQSLHDHAPRCVMQAMTARTGLIGAPL